MKKKLASTIGIIILLGLAGYFFRDRILKIFFAPRQTTINVGVTSPNSSGSVAPNVGQLDVEVVAQDLDIPWEIVFLPSGEMLVTERPGTLLKIGNNREVVQKIEGVVHIGEGGLLGMALDPDFEKNNFIYLYSTSKDNSGYINRVEKYQFDGNKLTERKVILEGITGSANHDGGRIRFGPDGKLYVTTGDAETPALAQDTNSLNGKILRINSDGSIPADNPFGNAVYSYGHRNPQGLAWDNEGRLWETEHGPSGLQTGDDEVNLIERGNNYGWPDIRGDETKAGMQTPIINSGRTDTWAPSGLEYYNGALFFAGLRGSALYEAKLTRDKITGLTAHFKNEYGRLRTVKLGPDGYFYILTNNTDGRGTPKAGDDKIIKINPEIFLK